eukprot:5443408-Prymnesium_polylepis.2
MHGQSVAMPACAPRMQDKMDSARVGCKFSRMVVQTTVRIASGGTFLLTSADAPTTHPSPVNANSRL